MQPIVVTYLISSCKGGTYQPGDEVLFYQTRAVGYPIEERDQYLLLAQSCTSHSGDESTHYTNIATIPIGAIVDKKILL